MMTPSPSTISHQSLAAEFDPRIAGTELLFDVAAWYSREYYSPANLELRLDHGGDWDCSANENAALALSISDCESEAEITTRACGCTRRHGDICQCYATLEAARADATSATTSAAVDSVQEEPPNPPEIVSAIDAVERVLVNTTYQVLRARGAKVIPHEIGLWSAMLFLAPQGDELAIDTLAVVLRERPVDDPTPPSEVVFQNRRYVALLFEAIDTQSRPCRRRSVVVANNSALALCWHRVH
jgi:hypothetical protein